jgi:hypothetical protein
MALKMKRRLGLEVCRLDGTRWIHADTVQLMNRRTWPGLYRRFKEDSFRHGADDEWENLAWTPQAVQARQIHADTVPMTNRGLD